MGDTVAAPKAGATPVVVVGEGGLARAVGAKLADSIELMDPNRYQSTATAWLPIRLRFGEAIIGPATGAGYSGCPRCADVRRMAAGAPGAPTDGPEPAAKDPWLNAFAVDALASVIADEVDRLADHDANRRPRTGGAIIRFRLDTLMVSTHRLVADPQCPVCGRPGRATEGIELTSRKKSGPGRYRVTDLDQLGPRLIEAYVDEQVGMVAPVRQLECYGLAVASAQFGWRQHGPIDSGAGRALDHDTSRYTAVLEALERYCGMAPGGRSVQVRACYDAVRDRAVDPRRFGLYPRRRYTLPGFPFRPFRPEAELDWVAGYSFRRGDQVLVPASLAYYGPLPPSTGQLAYEVSNGCALGGCLEEAILHGILEVAERDAFLMTWYGRMRVPEIELASARDRSVPLLAERIERLSGYTIRVFETTVEQGIPACWALALGRHGWPDQRDRPEQAAVLCAAGAHLDLERACLNALGELATMLGTIPAQYARHVDRVRRMVAEPDLVLTMDDHGLLYCDPVAARRLDFLTAPRARHPFPSEPALAPHDDLLDDVRDLVARYLATGLDVIVVDQTTEELSAVGLACVKVLIPGTLPMTFGHRFRRVHGLPRALTVPHLLGHRRAPLRPRDLNPHPHPFP